MNKDSKDIPVLLITGYLGSGKTTLLNHILRNEEGVKIAVIVNDIGEINIDAELLQKDGIVNKEDESLIALQNGCICCTLQNDLVEQVFQLMKMQCFDYIVIEASGICDPEPIARTLCTIPMLGNQYTQYGNLRLDCITTIVDALRMKSEFNCADRLSDSDIEEEDITNLLIQQIEFCNLILLNKASEVEPEELNRIKKILQTLQPKAEIIPCDYADVDLFRLIHTRAFDFRRVATSAGWISAMGKHTKEQHAAENAHHEHGHEEHDEHCHHHEGGACNCHHHHHGEGEAEEYGIGTFVYYRRRPFNLQLFDDFINLHWPKNIIRAKGICYFKEEFDISYLYEQAGVQRQLTQMGVWYASFPEEDINRELQRQPQLANDWDGTYGDRMQKIVFIGQQLDKEALARALDECLED